MKNTRVMVVATAAALALGLSACAGSQTPGTSTTGGGGGGNAGAAPAADAALKAIVRPTDKKGGTLRFGISSDWDSVDTGDTYYGLSWDFLRNYARTLVAFKAAPGQEGNQARRRPRDGSRQAERRQQDVDLHPS